MTHFKDHLIPLPIAGEPDLFAVRFAGIRYQGTKDDCAAVAARVVKAAGDFTGEIAVDEFKQQQYEEVWLPMLRRRTVPKYVPDWAREMYDAAEAAA